MNTVGGNRSSSGRGFQQRGLGLKMRSAALSSRRSHRAIIAATSVIALAALSE